MSGQEGKKGVTCRRLIYLMIEYLTNVLNCKVHISSYYINKGAKGSSEFKRTKISRFIAQNNSYMPSNRLCIAVAMDDEKWCTKRSYKMLQEKLENIKETFWQSEILDVLEQYEPETIIKFVTKNGEELMVRYIIIIFNLPNKSSIEFIITTNKLSPKIIERDEEGKIIDYQYKLQDDMTKFENERKERMNPNSNEESV